jgi:hypothetical protein
MISASPFDFITYAVEVVDEDEEVDVVVPCREVVLVVVVVEVVTVE